MYKVLIVLFLFNINSLHLTPVYLKPKTTKLTDIHKFSNLINKDNNNPCHSGSNEQMNYFHNRMFYSSTYNFLRKLLTIGAVFIGYRFCGLVQLLIE